MIASSSTRSVLFDVGGVLVDSHPDPLAVAALLGEETAAFARLVDQAIWAHRREYDAGCSDRQFWDRVAGDCGLPEPSPATLKELVGLDTARMLDANPDVIELARDLRRGGARLGIVSNAPYSVSRSIKESEWGSCFDFFVFSCDYGVCKPSSRDRTSTTLSSSMTARSTCGRPSSWAWAGSCGRIRWTRVSASESLVTCSERGKSPGSWRIRGSGRFWHRGRGYSLVEFPPVEATKSTTSLQNAAKE